MTDTFVIVGASLTGVKAAETLRSEGFDGRVVLIGAEPEHPYERPPLSKGILLGDEQSSVAYVHEPAWYDDHDVELRLDSEVIGVDRDGHRVEFRDGQRLEYTKLLLATGAAPRRLDVPGGDLDGVHYLRRLPDSERIRGAIETGGARVVVIGAGWIGMETAAAARTRGCDVTIVEPQSTPLSASLGDEIGGYFADLHRGHGVDLRLGRGVTEVRGDTRVSAVVTDDGEQIPCDHVIVGIGARPDTALAHQCGLSVDNGIVTDRTLRTADPDVFAAGDVANAFHPFYGHHVRVEHWDTAMHSGPVAARSMLGQDVDYDRVPYFFTDQYDVGMEYSGRLPSGDYDTVIRGDLAANAFYAFWLVDDTIVAGMHVNLWDDGIEPVTRLIRDRAKVDGRRLADPAVPLPDVRA